MYVKNKLEIAYGEVLESSTRIPNHASPAHGDSLADAEGWWVICPSKNVYSSSRFLTRPVSAMLTIGVCKH